MLELDVAIRGLVKEACKLADNARDADAIAWMTCVLHTALVRGQPSAVLQAPLHASNIGEAALQLMQAYLRELEAVRKQLGGGPAAADTLRAAFFWLHFEAWASVLLSGKTYC